MIHQNQGVLILESCMQIKVRVVMPVWIQFEGADQMVEVGNVLFSASVYDREQFRTRLIDTLQERFPAAFAEVMIAEDRNWREVPTPRRRQIEDGLLRHLVFEAGFKLHKGCKADIGNRVKDVNDVNPGLGLTTEEMLPIIVEYVDEMKEAFLQPKKEKVAAK
jgi:hypothetical protein